MNNDYKGGSWSERFSWIITIVAMVLVAILSIGLLCALFIQPKDDKQEDTEQTAVNEQATVMDGEGNAMVSGKTYAMPQRMVFAVTAAEAVTASEGITLTATVSPETADNISTQGRYFAMRRAKSQTRICPLWTNGLR